MKKLVEDIVIICVLCIVTVVCRKIVIDKINSNDIDIVNQVAYDVDVESNNDMLYLMTDEYARNDMVADNIKISSNSNNSSDYKLYLRLDNNSTLDDDSLKVLVNDKEYKYFRKISWIILSLIIVAIIVSFIFKFNVVFAPCCASLIFEGVLIGTGQIKKAYSEKRANSEM